MVFYFAASYCVPGFFLLSGYLLGQRERLSIEYVETKITEIMKKLFLWAVFWASAHFICTGEIIDLWGNITAAAGSGGILPTAWFLFTYCFLLLLGYPLQRLKQKQKGLFCTASMIWIVLLAFGFGSGLHDTRTQSLWLHLYAGYFCFGMSLSVTGGSISRIIPRKYGLFPVFLTGTAALAVYAVQVQAKGGSGSRSLLWYLVLQFVAGVHVLELYMDPCKK
ncbi:MAG: acyltransferase [Eubacterium sp.]|nr:acyltransferase [Eubacterium sp.]